MNLRPNSARNFGEKLRNNSLDHKNLRDSVQYGSFMISEANEEQINFQKYLEPSRIKKEN